MKAFVKESRTYGAVRLLDIPKPQAAPGQVLIQVKAAAIWAATRTLMNTLPDMIHESSGYARA